ncbi:hypothetical protein [Mycobacterium sp. 1164985.4]|uniref:hypothetical protein n=1 Tax=Mycobacterium sp. 1164985.4 TaxID=1834069 RepID=UPI0012EAC3EC|nr:hypothetical protein [Mycobacterium sp. 1164985.4]
MTSPEESRVTPATDEGRAIATLTIAFSSDPVARWFLSDASRYLTYWPPFVRALAGEAFAAGTADSVDDCGGPVAATQRGVERRGDGGHRI